jgi:hypothetical protein
VDPKLRRTNTNSTCQPLGSEIFIDFLENLNIEEMFFVQGNSPSELVNGF